MAVFLKFQNAFDLVLSHIHKFCGKKNILLKCLTRVHRDKSINVLVHEYIWKAKWIIHTLLCALINTLSVKWNCVIISSGWCHCCTPKQAPFVKFVEEIRWHRGDFWETFYEAYSIVAIESIYLMILWSRSNCVAIHEN